MAEQFDESPYTPDELAMLRTGEVTEIPAAQADQSLAMIYRKAAAFDALDAMLASGRVILKRPIYNRDLRIVDYAGSRILVFHVDQLVDGIEQVDHMLKEPTDAK